jgi:hypothetical protein
MLLRRWPEVHVHQIDARRDVVLEASKHNPAGRVEQMLASNMRAIATGSKQLVVAMSVFDQNAVDLWPGIAREVHRVLAPEGVVVYIHNEELNLPAAAATLLKRSGGGALLLPSDSWRPGNELEYCSGARQQIEAALLRLGEEAAPFAHYLCDVYPQLYRKSQAVADGLHVSVPHMQDYTYPVMSRIRSSVSQLRKHGVSLEDHPTPRLLRSHVEDGIFGQQHGFEIERAGMFEIRRTAPWRSSFKSRPAATYFARGTTRFGYAGDSAPPPLPANQQDLNRNPVPSGDELLLIAYQYGMVARKLGK